MTTINSHRGFVLITVLIVTSVGLLFGAGALLLFRYQCQKRIDRQHEFEKIYAVRSALNYIRTASKDISAEGQSFLYHTGSSRDLGVIVKPVAPIFPSDPARHFFMANDGNFQVPTTGNGGYDVVRDYECGGSGVTNLVMSNTGTDLGSYGIAFTDMAATNGVKWWVNIGMRETGGWLQEDFGRRYYFDLKYRVEAENETCDRIRLCIIRNVTNELNVAGGRHGWPLSQIGERALVFEVLGDEAAMTLSEYVYENGGIRQRLLVRMDKCQQTLHKMGVQLADDKISVFYIDNRGNQYVPHGYFFSEVVGLSAETLAYFSQQQMIGGKIYGGVVTNESGEVHAPELRAVIEVEASSSIRPANDSHVDFLTDFRVTPAYQYDIHLEYPSFVTNLATVAQIIGSYDRVSPNYTVLSYDTHGTENKGFRKDEREAERKRNGR